MRLIRKVLATVFRDMSETYFKAAVTFQSELRFSDSKDGKQKALHNKSFSNIYGGKQQLID